MNYRDIVVSAECQLRFWCNLFILAFILLFIALTYYEKKVVAHPTEIQVCLSMIFAARRQPLGSAERLVFATQSSLICLSVCVCVSVCLSVCLSIRTNGIIRIKNSKIQKWNLKEYNSRPTNYWTYHLPSTLSWRWICQFVSNRGKKWIILGCA